MTSVGWVGQRAADGLLFGRAAFAVACQSGASEADTALVREVQTGVREAWSSRDLGAEVGESGYLNLLGESGPLLVPYCPVSDLEVAVPRRLVANSVKLFSHLDDNISSASDMADARLCDIAYAITRLADEDYLSLVARVGSPMVAKRRCSTAGAGCFLIASFDDFLRAQTLLKGEPVVVAQFLTGPSYNVHGVVDRFGDTSVWAPSEQLIGLPEFTNNRLGYCGNIFGRVPRVHRPLLRRTADTLGGWLAELGYRGIFGVDIVVSDGEPHVVDVNPRLQASSLLLDMLTPGASLGNAHLWAFGASGRAETSGGDDLGRDLAYVQLMVRNGSENVVRTRGPGDGVFRLSCGSVWTQTSSRIQVVDDVRSVTLLDLPPRGVVVRPGACLFRSWFAIDPNEEPVPALWAATMSSLASSLGFEPAPRQVTSP